MAVGITQSAETIFAPTQSNGSARRPSLADAQRWGVEVERLIAATISNGPIFGSVAAAAANLNWPADTMAWLYNQAAPAENGIYRKSGASGSGSWARVGALPYNDVNIQAAIDAGAVATSAAGVATSAATEAEAAAAEATAAAGVAAAAADEANLAADVATAAADEAAAAAGAAGGGANNQNTRASAILATIPSSAEYVRTAGYSTVGDGGEGLYARVASEPSHLGKFQSADGAWWELIDSAPNPRQFGAVGDGVTDDIAAFNAALTTGSVYVPEGFYRVSGSIGINNASMPGETESGPGGRTIIGQDARLSVIRSLVGASGPVVGITYGTGAQAHAYHRFEKLSIIGRNTFNGMDITNAAFLRLSDLTLRGCSTGLRLRSVLSSTIRDCRFDNNATGVEANKATGFSFTNAVKFDGCVFSNNTAIGLAIGDGAHNVQIIGGTVEGNGTQGNTGTGGIFLGFNGGEEGAVGALIEGVYFENNAGAADIRLENIGTDYVTVIIRGCNFNRISSTNFVTNNITAIGNINLVLIGNAFKAFGTYVENAGRQYVNRGANVRLTSIGNMFKSTVAATGMNSRGNLEKARGSVSSAGSALSLPEGWSVANTSTGVYRVTHNMGLDPSLYSVVASSTDTVSNQVQRVVKGALGNSFDVVLSTPGGTLINAPFDFVVFVG